VTAELEPAINTFLHREVYADFSLGYCVLNLGPFITLPKPLALRVIVKIMEWITSTKIPIEKRIVTDVSYLILILLLLLILTVIPMVAK
jgi:hypothetical protein